MKNISKIEIIEKIKFENPWWDNDGSIDDYFKEMKPRAYLNDLYKIITEKGVSRATVLMGPRRVGKTVLLYHVIQKLIDSGVEPKRICYISVEAPVYIGCRLDELLKYYLETFDFKSPEGSYIFFDEIQYLKGWELHLKRLVDDYRHANFIASGSAAAALKLKSIESGAGRFTNFSLPPLTFYEYLYLLEKDHLIDDRSNEHAQDLNYSSTDIKKLNEEFINYLNFGGYPEALFSESIQADPERYIRSDIIDKVLMRDLPSLYGIQDIQELNRLFTMLAYNTGNEVSLDELSKGAGVAKNTIKKYLEYLEAAFLITIIHRIDQSGKRFKRANYFKVYLTNPSMRCALFGPIHNTSEMIGNMAETAIFSQWQHSIEGVKKLFYARWKDGEVDLVSLIGNKVSWCVEVKWSDAFYKKPGDLKSLVRFANQHSLSYPPMTTTIKEHGTKVVDNITIKFVETSIYCYLLGLHSTKNKGDYLYEMRNN